MRRDLPEPNGRYPVPLWEPGAERALDRTEEAWTAEEDVYVMASIGLPVAVVASHLGRAVPGVRQRQAFLRRRQEGET